MKITYPDAKPTTLKLTHGVQIYRLFFEHGLRLGGFAAVESAIKDALQLPHGFKARYKCKEGKDKILTDKTFCHFLSMASGPKESAHKVLRLDVAAAKAQEPALSRQGRDTWQQDPRNLEELVAQFSDEDTKVNTESPPCARRSRKTKQKKTNGTRKMSCLDEARPHGKEHVAENSKTPLLEDDREDGRSERKGAENASHDAGPEERNEWLSKRQMEDRIHVGKYIDPEQEELCHDKNDQTREEEAGEKMERRKQGAEHDDDGDDDYDDGGDGEHDEFKQCAESILENADGLSRSKSCPCLPTHVIAKENQTNHIDSDEPSPGNGGCLWPATPDSTPPSSPRQGCGQHHIAWMPMPVIYLVARFQESD